MSKEEYEALERKFEEMLNGPIPYAKPKAVMGEVSQTFEMAAKANPDSVRMSARGADGMTVIERPCRVRVLEVDNEGRPALVETLNPTTGEREAVEFRKGYGPPSQVVYLSDKRAPGRGAVSNYDPIGSGLRGDD